MTESTYARRANDVITSEVGTCARTHVDTFPRACSFKILLPRRNERDVLSAEVFFGGIPAHAHVAFELAASGGERAFIVRGDEQTLARLKSHVRMTWPQCEFVDLTDDDPASLMQGGTVGGLEVRLSEAMYLPLRTHITREGRVDNRDLELAGDPMLPLLSALDGLDAGEGAIIQFALTPLPRDWSKWFRGRADEVGLRARLTPRHLFGAAMLAGFFMCLSFGTLSALIAFAFGARGFGVGAGVLLALAVICIVTRFKLPSPPDPELVRQKVMQSAFRTCVRVFVRAADEASGQRRIDEIAQAFEGYNLPGANGFCFVPLEDGADVRVVHVPQPREGVMAAARAYFTRARDQQPILSVSEMAALWHLPHYSAGLQDAHMVQSRRLMPAAHSVGEGAHIGVSRMQGREIQVHLPASALKGNIGLLAKTQSGKSNLMAILVEHVMREEPDAAIILIDPHRTLAEAVARLVPPERQRKTIYWNLADTARPFGLNLIDRRLHNDASADKRIDDIIGTLHEIWPENWGPRMETYFRGPLLTMAYANDSLLRDVGLDQWVHHAQAALAANKDQIAKGELDAISREMLNDVAAGLERIQTPGRAGQAKRYRQFLGLVAAWRAALASADQGEQIKAASAVFAAVQQTDESRRPGARGEVMSTRIFGAPPKPLQYSLLDVSAMLLSSAFQSHALQCLSAQEYPHVFSFWRESYDAYKQTNTRLLLDMITPVTTKVTRFLTSDVARRIFGQSDTTIDIPAHLNAGGVLLIDLAAGVVGQDTAALVGATVLNTVAAQIYARQRDSGPARPVYVVVDEFQSVPGADYAFMLSELAKYGVRLILGTQSLKLLDQANQKTAASWLNNTSTLFVFNASADDAQVLAKELATGAEDALTVQFEDIVGLREHECFVRMKDATRTPHVFRVATRRAGAGDARVKDAIIATSRSTYGRDVREVDAQLHHALALRGNADLAEISQRPRSAGPSAEPTGFLDVQEVVDRGKAASRQAVSGTSGAEAFEALVALVERAAPDAAARLDQDPDFVQAMAQLEQAGWDQARIYAALESRMRESDDAHAIAE